MIALVAALLALPLQVLGYATTCTMGDSDSAITGSLLSAPLLVLALLLLLWALVKNARRARPVATALVLTATLVLTSGIWFNTALFNTPCGPDFVDYANSGSDVGLILAFYVGLPVLNIALCLMVFLRMRQSR
jgi:hypothetical protein